MRVLRFIIRDSHHNVAFNAAHEGSIMAVAIDPATRKKVLKVVFISLLLDLVCTLFL